MTREELLTQEALLKHAIVRWVDVYPNGRESQQKTLHYLTCVKCALRRELDLPEEKEDVKTV